MPKSEILEHPINPNSITADSFYLKLKAVTMLEEVKAEVIEKLEPFFSNEVPELLQDYIAEIILMNTKRLAKKNRTYYPPTIVFLDSKKLPPNGSDDEFLLESDNSIWSADINTVILVLNRHTLRKERSIVQAMIEAQHELSHSASYRVQSVTYNQETDDDEVNVLRAGGRISQKNFRAGNWIDEGHLTAEGLLIAGADCPYSDPDFENVPKLINLFPNQRWLVNQIPAGYRSFIPDLYEYCPDLYSLGRDFLFEGKTLAFAKSLDSYFGKGTFIDLNYPFNDETAITQMSIQLQERIARHYPLAKKRKRDQY